MKREKRNKLTSAIRGFFSVKSAESIEDLQWVKYKNQKTGHGFSAEDANSLHDKMKRKKVDKIGQSNQKNGADRIVNGQMIQTKYYKSAVESVESAFDKESGIFRYKQQLLEVPKDQYEKAIKQMSDKIREGKVPGVKNPNDAEKIIKKGDVTYRQARNIAKAGNIDSLFFDIKTQSIVSMYSFGISFALQYASCVWNGMDKKDALKLSLTSSFKTGSIVLGSSVITQQLLRTSVGRNFAVFTSGISKRVIDQLYSTELGKKAIHKIASVMLGKALVGSVAKNAVVKLLRTNMITSTVTIAAISLPDFYKALVSKKVSWKQFTKNFTVNVTGVAGGAAGVYGGAVIGGMVGATIGTFFSPVIGTAIGSKIGIAIGGFTGGLGLGVGASMGSKKLLDLISEDDAQEMFRMNQDIIVELATDYMVTEEELQVIIENKISKIITPKWLEKMYQSGQSNYDKANAQYSFAYDKLAPIFEETIKMRNVIFLPKKKVLNKEINMIYLFLFFQYTKMKISKFFGIKSELSAS